MNFYAEYGEDRVLFDRYPAFFLKPQFYVDVGCAHPVIGSNTAFLRELGWSGLHIDGDSDWAPHWGGNFIHSIVSSKPEVEFTVNPVHCLSRVENGGVKTPARTLESILKDRNVDAIGLLSIDVEGHEMEVISSFGIEQYWPQFIISEYNTMGIGEDYSVRNFLEGMGYETIHQTVANFVYARRAAN